MSNSHQDLLDLTLAFFGRVTARGTHEIKNELAVMNEQIHLMQEMLALAESGREPDLNRLSELTQRIIVRLEQADGAVKRLNKFAHSADLEQKGADMVQSLKIVEPFFFGRLTGGNRLTLKLEGEDISAGTDKKQALLEQAIWACLESVAEAAEPEQEIRSKVEKRPDGLALCFEARLSGQLQEPPSQILDPLGARVTILEQGGLEMIVPF
ncbi:hypothetical protein [Dethiosulfatarculus sandiegensis]|uniref:Uncharacterized protein n=1 Tax=Dethiosulfatarculus sandiegensis TaxID=1429043 RepID=A0A0D2J4V3_9BACT|nr:hypothetical protein [Dethiosulfatarculus sandiegensis]KIX13169.1 hypothetical protein X474_15680 [Dethiosulfatarculus sandiegensis]